MVGVPVIVPLELIDKPDGKVGDTVMVEIGPPAFNISSVANSLRTIENAVEVAFNEIDGACSTIPKLNVHVCKAEVVVAVMV